MAMVELFKFKGNKFTKVESSLINLNRGNSMECSLSLHISHHGCSVFANKLVTVGITSDPVAKSFLI